MPVSELAGALGYPQADWRFHELNRSANQYGMVEGSGNSASVALTNLGRDIVAPSSPSQRTAALEKAFRAVPDFAKVADFYGSKPIPEDEFFLNTLTREVAVPRERTDTFAKVFRVNVAFLSSFQPADRTAARKTTVLDRDRKPDAGNEQLDAPQERRAREFLSTCFVMMPFGSWFDRYYKEIYVPAINDAGFEAIRADELFSSGSVVEQIWEQIAKADVLLADLTDRNANVFYELGLAHATSKPVVFAAAKVEDVPFDLRHLRVIIYDVREPAWATRLQKSIADYLRAAVKDPAKSIPHPFRPLSHMQEAASD